MDTKKIHLEVFHEGEHGIPCVYMTRVVESVAPEFENILSWDKVVTKDLGGARRFTEFSKAIGRLVPIPSIAIEGELVFETTPSVEELKACILDLIKKRPNPPY